LMDSAQVGDIGQLKHEGQGKEDEGDGESACLLLLGEMRRE
jgi:hypothetical protein